MSISLSLERADFYSTIKPLIDGVEDFGEVSEEIAQLLENSIRRNFKEGGRPSEWTPSKRAEGDSGQTLLDSARLMNSIVGVGESTQVKVGTNVTYARAHNKGVDKIINEQVRGHVRRITQAFGKPIEVKEVRVRPFARQRYMKIQQREFMVIQQEDWGDIEDIITLKINRLAGGN